MLTIAFKEWAIIVQALADGVQSLILRKGGIAEVGGEFKPEHTEFLLYPTYFHEHRNGVKPAYLPLWDAIEAEKPAEGEVRFTHLARVAEVQQLANLEAALALDSLHLWTPEIVRQRFHYRTPGLFVLTVRVFRLAVPVTRPVRPEYAGCKTWVELDSPVATHAATPVLTDETFEELRARIHP